MHEIHAKHHEDVVSVSFSPDGTRMVSTGNNATICVWDATTGVRVERRETTTLKCVHVLRNPHHKFSKDVDGGHYGSVYSASYSPDGTRIVSASMDETVRVWDATTGACISVLEGHSGMVFSASYSPDGMRVVSASMDMTVRVWDSATGACLSVLEGHSEGVNSASYSADGTRIVSASWDYTVRVWDATTGACISVLEGHSDYVRSARHTLGARGALRCGVVTGGESSKACFALQVS